ncbi:Carbohydrate sulfotransferase 1 [Armadillidium nasatum]|uniref:Carbohydrate sulfotransferase 1 n=1 Tax=Armadillidium nasatum TaxID=96803 RepID=A0A5N5SVX5_9CRUS|nr:Carbohydrate sulfotransferase 1 [Armadillidium nasatum]
MLINDSINDLGMNIPEPVKFAMIRQLFQCGVSTEFMKDYKRWNEIYPKRHCSGEDECPPLDITDVVDDCLNADYRIIKTVRMNLETVEDFFRLPSFRMLKVIFLVRDPRGTMKSMTHIAKEKKIWNVTAQEMCSRIRNNAIMFHTLNRLYPNRLYFLRYEDMSLRPFEKALELWRFINASSTAVEIPEGWKTFLNESQTSKNITEAHDHPFNIKARSTKYWQSWRKEISKGDFNEVQKYCKDVLENLGYKEFRSFKIMRNMSISSITKKNCENIPC